MEHYSDITKRTFYHMLQCEWTQSKGTHTLDHSTYPRCLKHSEPQMHIRAWCFPKDTQRKEIVTRDNNTNQ